MFRREMHMSFLNSSASSTRHFRLVKQVEDSLSVAEVQRILTEKTEEVRRKWTDKGAGEPNEIKKDLIILMYCLSQNGVCGEDRVDVRFALPIAVQLAGSSLANLQERKIGYRFCSQVFTNQGDPLKLLLVNTIRSDLNVVDYAPLAISRWEMGLEACCVSSLICDELVPAIIERIYALCSHRITTVRRLAIQAMLSLLRTTDHTSPSLFRGSEIISNALRSEQDPSVLRVLIQASGEESPFYSLLNMGKNELLNIYIRILRGEDRTAGIDYHGVRSGWLAVSLLDRIETVLRRDEVTGEDKERVMIALLEYYAEISEGVDLAFGLTVSICKCLAHLTPSSKTPHFQSLLLSFKKALFRSNPNIQWMALKCLSLLEPEVWTESEVWDEKGWERIMSFLESRDAGLRKQAVLLLKHVDGELVEMHVTRLYNTLDSLRSKSTNNLEKRSRLVILLLETSEIIDRTIPARMNRLNTILNHLKSITQSSDGENGEGAVIFEPFVRGVIDWFLGLRSEEKRMFWEAMDDKGGKDADEFPMWKKDVNWGLIFAATVGVGMDESEGLITIARTTVRYLESSRQNDYIRAQLEHPIILSLFRLISWIEGDIPSDLQSIPTRVFAQIAKENQPLLKLYEYTLSTPACLKALKESGKAETVPGFWEEFTSRLSVIEQEEEEEEGAEGKEKEKIKERVPQKSPQKMAWKGKSSEGAFTRRNKAYFDRSDREERGGYGGPGMSLMSPGALALLTLGDDPDEDGESAGSGNSDSSRRMVKRMIAEELEEYKSQPSPPQSRSRYGNEGAKDEDLIEMTRMGEKSEVDDSDPFKF